MRINSKVIIFITRPISMIKLPIAVTLLLLSSASVALAQFDSGQISGFVRESSQAAVTNATVTVTNAGNGQRLKTSTNSEGYYAFPNLVVGTYSVTAEAPGFSRFIENNVKLSAARKVSVVIELQVGEVTETVEITASTSQVQTETAQVGRTVDAR